MEKVSDDDVRVVMQEVVDKFLIPRFNQLGMNATGEWLDSLEVYAENGKGYINGRAYSEQLEFGRKPGKRPPIAPLQKWAQAKLGLSEQAAKGAAFAISNKIAEKGTSWYEKGGSDLLDVLSEDATLKYIYDRIGAGIRVQVEQEILKIIRAELWQQA